MWTEQKVPAGVLLWEKGDIFSKRLSCLSALVLVASCGDWALTIEAQRNLMELWHGPILVMWLVGPRTFVLLHPSICVGWTDPSQESPNRLFAFNSLHLLYLLYPSCHFLLHSCQPSYFFFIWLISIIFIVYFYFAWFLLLLFFSFFSGFSLDSTSTSCCYSLPVIMWVECVQKHTHTSKIMSNDIIAHCMGLLLWRSVEISVITSLPSYW